MLTLASSEASVAGRFTRQFCRCTIEISAAVECAFFRGAMLLSRLVWRGGTRQCSGGPWTYYYCVCLQESAALVFFPGVFFGLLSLIRRESLMDSTGHLAQTGVGNLTCAEVPFKGTDLGGRCLNDAKQR